MRYLMAIRYTVPGIEWVRHWERRHASQMTRHHILEFVIHGDNHDSYYRYTVNVNEPCHETLVTVADAANAAERHFDF